MRRIVVCCVALLMILLSFALGYMFGGKTAYEPATAASDAHTANVDPIKEFRSERQMTRQMQISQLNELMHSSDAGDDVVLMARRRLLSLMDWAEKETTIEGILNMREFEDAVVTVHDDSVNVLVKGDGLTQRQTAVILEIVMRETGISGGNVKIIPIN